MRLTSNKIASILAVLALTGCSKSGFDKKWTAEKSPKEFTARFETTKGIFEIEVKREHSPKAADRLYQLIAHEYFDNAIFYRVVPQYIAQFGNTDLEQMQQWRETAIPDEPVALRNKKGTVSFARYGKDSRDLELFINLNDNPELDTAVVAGVKGYPAVGRVSKGMAVVERLYSGYGEKTMADSQKMYEDRSRFVRSYPNLDIIKTAYIVETAD